MNEYLRVLPVLTGLCVLCAIGLAVIAWTYFTAPYTERRDPLRVVAIVCSLGILAALAGGISDVLSAV